MLIDTTAVEHHPLVNQSYVYLLPRMCLVYSWLRHGIEKAVLRWLHIDVLVQERRISVANALELRLPWTNTSICDKSVVTFLCEGYYSISYRVWVCLYTIDTYVRLKINADLPGWNRFMKHENTFAFLSFLNIKVAQGIRVEDKDTWIQMN